MILASLLRIGLTAGSGLLFLLWFRRQVLDERPDIVDAENRIETVFPRDLFDEYDFIIIGGGSAGSVLASRLSEVSKWNILLIEAGPDEPPMSDIPQLFPMLQSSPFDWKFKTEPSNDYCLAMTNNQCHWPRGRVLGGSSVLNAMLYIRGNRKDYDFWAKLGNTGWNYDNILYYFKKAEDMRDPHYRGHPLHGIGGPIGVERFRYESPMMSYYLRAAAEVGLLNPNGDFNGPSQFGFSRSHGTLRDGLRCSTAKAYLRPVRDRANLHIMLHTTVHKVHIDGETKKASCVSYETFGQFGEVCASREIILSAGAIQTPQLLMLSGIGPGNHLQELGIPVIKHAPGVGENLMDHVAASGTTYLVNNPAHDGSPLSYIIPDTFSEENAEKFTQSHYGPFYGNPAAEGMAFLNTKYQNPKEDWPDVQFFLGSYGYLSDGGLIGRLGSGISLQNFDEVFEPIIYQDSFMVIPLLLRPKSRGKILLQSKDAKEHPLIYPNYFDHPKDLAILVEALKIIHKITYTHTMRSINATLNPYIWENCPHTEFLSDDFWACHARHYSQTIYHPCGTAKMGIHKDPWAVVDPRLRVYGIHNLRVVDASIMPTIPSGNTNAPTIMIAEKAADMIKEEYFHYNGGY